MNDENCTCEKGTRVFWIFRHSIVLLNEQDLITTVSWLLVSGFYTHFRAKTLQKPVFVIISPLFSVDLFVYMC